MSDSDLEKWWNAVKDNAYWSGSIRGFSWEELWPDARAALKLMYNAVNRKE